MKSMTQFKRKSKKIRNLGFNKTYKKMCQYLQFLGRLYVSTPNLKRSVLSQLDTKLIFRNESERFLNPLRLLRKKF